MDTESALDRIYEAAVLPELWPSTLEILAAATGSIVGLIVHAASNGVIDFVSTPGSEQWLEEYERLGLFARSQRLPRLIGRPHSGFVSDSTIYAPGEQATDPAYLEFFWPKGLGIGAASTIRFSEGGMAVVDFERVRSRGEFLPTDIAWLDGIRPHLARACTLSLRVERERDRARIDTLAAIGLPAAILDHAGRLLTDNEQFRAMVPNRFLDFRTRLTLNDLAADVLFATALAAGPADRCTRTIPVRGTEALPPIVVHVIPIRRGARDVFSKARHIVAVSQVSPRHLSEGGLIEGLFDLTAAEARVARAIGAGETVETIAARTGVARETVRTQLRSVFAKTGTGRQAELVGLLASISL